MAKIDRDNLGFLGLDYQMRFVAQLLTDNRFAETIIEIVDPNYFADPYLRVIVATIKDAKVQDDIIPDMGSIEFRLLGDIKDDIQQKYALSQLNKIKNISLHDTLKVQDIAMKFCKQQELKKSIKSIQVIIDKGDFESYDECESILRKALEHGDNQDDTINVLDNIESILSDDFRQPIRTGISFLDEVMNGGLSKGELALILAPFGVGKTTMITKIANTAMNDGYNVIQIFFEDNPKVIQRKHLSCWTGIDLNDLSLHTDDIINLKNEKNNNAKGSLKLKKFPSAGTTIPMIRQYIRKQISEGFRPDIILLDYIDCVTPSRRYDDANIGEGSVMREFESMLDELNLAGWTAVQGNRSSIKATVVESDQMGGSIKKGQIGHFIVSIAKSLDQKEDGTATMAILKSRFGKDGLIFEDVIFNNSTIQIENNEFKSGRTQVEHRKDVEVNNQQRVNDLLNATRLRREALNNGN